MPKTPPSGKKRAALKKKSTPKKKTAARKKLPQPSPGDLLLRTSERSTFKRCRWAWDRNYNDRLKPRVEMPALRFGTLIHKALELRYPPGIKRGPLPAVSFEKLYKEELEEAESSWGFRDADGEWADALDLGVHMMEQYVEKYGRDEEWKVIASEMTFKVPVPFEYAGEKRTFWYVGTMDGVWQSRIDADLMVVQDYKTTKNDPVKEGAGKGFLDEQGTAYWTWGVDALIAKGILKPREERPLAGMLYTFLRKAKRDTRPQDAQGYFLNQPKKDGTQERSKSQPPPLFHREMVYRGEADREQARHRAVEEVKDMLRIRDGKMEAYKTPETGATGHCGWCPYRDICELHEAGADWEGLRDVTMTEWDPYSDHEIEEEGKRS